VYRGVCASPLQILRHPISGTWAHLDFCIHGSLEPVPCGCRGMSLYARVCVCVCVCVCVYTQLNDPGGNQGSSCMYTHCLVTALILGIIPRSPWGSGLLEPEALLSEQRSLTLSTELGADGRWLAWALCTPCTPALQESMAPQPE
jgi:hypothetical protein